MRVLIAVLLSLSLFNLVSCKSEKGGGTSGSGNVNVVMKTSMGEMEIELYRDKAPVSVENFLSYTKKGFYDGTIFHRVINGFMIQGGGFTVDMTKKPTEAPIKNEADNGLKNTNGTLAMARTGVVDSATSQFFINVQDNPHLDHRSKDPRGYGYAVFGKVVKGMDVVEKIKAAPTTVKGMYRDVPNTPIVIESVRVK